MICQHSAINLLLISPSVVKVAKVFVQNILILFVNINNSATVILECRLCANVEGVDVCGLAHTPTPRPNLAQAVWRVCRVLAEHDVVDVETLVVPGCRPE